MILALVEQVQILLPIPDHVAYHATHLIHTGDAEQMRPYALWAMNETQPERAFTDEDDERLPMRAQVKIIHRGHDVRPLSKALSELNADPLHVNENHIMIAHSLLKGMDQTIVVRTTCTAFDERHVSNVHKRAKARAIVHYPYWQTRKHIRRRLA